MRIQNGATQVLRVAHQRVAARNRRFVPAAIVALLHGESGVTRLLILSQVVLSLQRPFTDAPQLRITGDRTRMGAHVNEPAVGAIAWVLIVLNGKLIFDTIAP